MMREDRFQKAFLVLFVAAISAAFVLLIWDFLLIILLAAVFASVCHPIYARLLQVFRGRAAAASGVTLLLLFLVVVGPLATLGSVVVREAVNVSDSIRPRVQELIQQPSTLDQYLSHVPYYERLKPYRAEILTRAGDAIGAIGSALVGSVTGAISGTVVFIVQFVIFVYTTFFLLIDGRRMVDRALAYVPLPSADKDLMLAKFVSVAKATLKGTILIGLVQGVLCGFAFWVVGIQGATFWGALMILLSIVPGVGGALVWGPAALVLALAGSLSKALFLAGFCGLVVGSIDNLLRPRLVGRDTQLHELFIFFSTIGGLVLFGPMGFVIGPIIAALFVTAWELYGVAFRRELSEAEPPVSR